MIGIGIVLGFIGLGFLCCALFDLVVYALPAIVGVAAGVAAYYSGAGVPGAIIVTIVAGALTLVAGEAAIERARSAALRTTIALLFAVPAALIGYILTHGVAELGVPSVVWQHVFALFGAAVAGATAWTRVTHPPAPGGEPLTWL